MITTFEGNPSITIPPISESYLLSLPQKIVLCKVFVPLRPIPIFYLYAKRHNNKVSFFNLYFVHHGNRSLLSSQNIAMFSSKSLMHAYARIYKEHTMLNRRVSLLICDTWNEASAEIKRSFQ